MNAPLAPQAGAENGPLRFLADGTLVSLKVTARELLRDGSSRSGFFALRFEGAREREIPLPSVTLVDGATLVVAGPNGLPRLTLQVRAAETALRLTLLRAEGMPPERDVSLGFRALLLQPYQVQATAPTVLTRATAREARVYWTDFGPRTALTGPDYGGFELIPTASP